MGAKRRAIERREMLRVVLDRQMGVVESRRSSLQTRAAILIGAATLAGATQFTSVSDFPLALASVFSLFAALFGALASFPAFGLRLHAETFRGYAARHKMPTTDLDEWIFEQYEILHEAEWASLNADGRRLRTGYVAILISLALTALAAAPTVSTT